MNKRFVLMGSLALVFLLSFGLVSAEQQQPSSCDGFRDLGTNRSCILGDSFGFQVCESDWNHNHWNYAWGKCIVPVVVETPIVNDTPVVVPVVELILPHNHKPYHYPEVTICKNGTLVFWKFGGNVLLSLPEAHQFGDIVLLKSTIKYPVCK